MVNIDLSGIELRLKKQDGKVCVFDPIRKGWFILTPEEHVRQYILVYLMDKMNYPKGLISVEKMIKVNNLNKRFDIIVYNREHRPWMLVECKAPEVPVSEKTLHQLLQYQQTMQCSYWLLTNGHQTYCANACTPENIIWEEQLPSSDDL